jgi:hypothetical protein
MPSENYILLERTELNASAASVTFANIPQSGYTDLKIVVSARTSSGATYENVLVTFNGNTGNSSSRELYGTGSGVGTGSGSGDGNGQGILYMNSGATTANTFGNGEIYIPNYMSTTAKSYSGESVVENNATLGLATLKAGLWNPSPQAAITTIMLSVGNSFLAGSTFSLYGIAAVGTTPAIAPKASGGNRIDNDSTYWYHTFTSSGTFVPQTGLSCDVLQIAGGGGSNQGGGGAGGLLAFTSQTLTTTSYNVTVGGGGTAGSGNGTVVGGNGNNSQFASLTTSVGGGGGGNGTPGLAGSGGSGGGAGQSGSGFVGGGSASPSGQGNAGGSNGGFFNDPYPGGGGGGAGAAGGNATSNSQSGGGGNGVSTYSSWGAATATGQDISGTRWFAGGGGGGMNNNPSSTSAGGNGGGGAGRGQGVAAIAGTAGTGGGAGGTGQGGAAGGSGIIIVRYPI